MNKPLTLLRGVSTGTGTIAVERRQEERTQVNSLGEIRIIDETGHLQIDAITIEDWNDAGCRFESGFQVKSGDIVAVKPLETDEKILQDEQLHLFEIVWSSRKIAFWAAGAVRLQGEKLASLKFPLANYTAKPSPK